MTKRSFASNLTIAALIIAHSFFICVSGCSKSSTSLPKPKIAILEDKQLEWADRLKDGFLFGLSRQGIDATIVSRSAAGDSRTLSALAEELAQGNFILIYSLGTQATQEVFRKTKTKPIIFGAVTDPKEAGFYGEDLRHPLGNITGTQDLWPYSAQFDVIKKLLPKVRKIGIIHNPNEQNSGVSVKYIKAECGNRNISAVVRSAATPSQIETAVDALLREGVDLLFIPSDNTVQASSHRIIQSCQKKKVPVFTGICEIVEKGALAAVGVDYSELGNANAQQAGEIILKGKQARELPVVSADKGNICINLGAAKNLGIPVPSEIIEKAFKIYEYQ
ncbi:MAG TPA: ABC transporter substrate-binding protein [Thermodesulfovibrionales bacterium]|nr:ABC transporter substrate-binding protein [Thermodesulfovibrionales bacterium]